MDPNVRTWLEFLFRWIHVIAGIIWIGHLYFFNWVNAQLVKTYDADSKKKVVPELMPRALYWFRWGAAYTWISGFLLAGLIYYMGNGLVGQAGVAGAPAVAIGQGAAVLVSLAVLFIGFLVYDLLWKNMAGKESAAVAVSFVLLAVVLFGLAQVFEGRALFIHLGALFGTLMAGNVWMRIWPAQRKIIAGIKGTGPAADPAVAALAGLRSKHNTYMSVPLVASMLSNHYPTIYSGGLNWLILLVVVVVGWGATKWLYVKSASSAPTQF